MYRNLLMDDIDRSQLLFKTIGQVLVSNIQEEWEEVKVEFIINPEDTSTFKMIPKIRKSGQEFEKVSIKILDAQKVIDSFKELRVITKKTDKDPWERAVFSINNAGKFNIDFKYPE